MHDFMHQYDEAMTDLVFDYMRGRLRDPVPLNRPGDGEALNRALEGLLTPTGNDPATVLKLYETVLSPGIISADSPRYLSFIPCAPTKASLLFDMVVTCASVQGIFWLEAPGAITAENQVLRILSDQAGMPDTAGGCFVTGGSAGNLSALVVARDMAKRRLGSRAAPRLRVAIGAETHSSVANALNVIGADPFVVPTSDHRLTGAALRKALEEDGDPTSVIAVVGTAGTTNAGLVDDLAGLAEVAGDYDLWFHVDGSYGGAGLFAPSVRDLFRGIEHADSLVVDPHKWLFAPFDCAALLYREPRLAKAVHTQDAPYLDAVQTGEREPEWNPTDYAFHLSRRARGMPLWFSLAVHGTDAYAEAIEAGIALARQTAALIRAEYPYLEVIREPELSNVVYRRRGWTAVDYHRWTQQVLHDQIGFVVPTVWEGESVARLAFLHPGTTIAMVRELLDSMGPGEAA